VIAFRLELIMRIKTGLFFYLFENIALIKSKSAAKAALSEQMLLSQGNDTQRQARDCGSTTGNSACSLPVILGGAFHTGIGMNQSALVVVNRHTWRIVRATSKQRSE
jgi:hypothetical protein